MDLIFNADIRFRSAFNALQVNSNQVIMTFVFSVKRDLAFFSGHIFHPRVWTIARREAEMDERRSLIFE